MKKIFTKFKIISSLILLLFLSIFYNISQEEKLYTDKTLSNSIISPYYTYSGVIHFHTVYSDGSGTLEEIIETANSLEIDFLISADHNTLKPLYEGKEGWYEKSEFRKENIEKRNQVSSIKYQTSNIKHQGILLLIGNEISSDSGHLLTIGLSKDISVEKDIPNRDQAIIDSVKSNGGLVFIAHPYINKNPWRNWNVKNYDGIEIVNSDKEWRDEKLSILLSLITYPVFKNGSLNSLIDNPTVELQKWDELLNNNSIRENGGLAIGLGCSDAHANIKINKKIKLKFPPYKRMFELIRTNIITKEPFNGNLEHDKAIVYSALNNGNCYIAYNGFCESKGFNFLLDTLSSNLIIISPDTTNVSLVVIKNGKKIKEIKSPQLRTITKIKADEGIYRVELYQLRRKLPFLWRLEKRPWIFSQAIKVKSNMKKFMYIDGSGNTYTIYNDSEKILEYDPVKPEFSSSGIYDGGDYSKNKISQDDYNKIAEILIKSSKNKSVQIENRVKGSGTIIIYEGNNKNIYILKPNSKEIDDIEKLLKALTQIIK